MWCIGGSGVGEVSGVSRVGWKHVAHVAEAGEDGDAVYVREVLD